MSFYIKEFSISPQALHKDDALPNGTRLDLTTRIKCNAHADTDEDEFTLKYSIGDKVLADSTLECSDNHPVDLVDKSKGMLDLPGDSAKISIEVRVNVVQKSTGYSGSASQSTWVQT